MAAATEAAGLTETEQETLRHYERIGTLAFAEAHPERTPKGWESWAYRARRRQPAPDHFEKFDGDVPLADLRAMYRRKTSRRERVHVIDLPLVPNEQYGHMVFIGDLHLGHPDCDYGRFETLRDWLAEHRHVRWIGKGDMLDVVTASSPGEGESALDYRESMAMLQDDLGPIIEQCDGLMFGNHEARLAKSTKVPGACPIRELSSNLGVPYLGYNCRIRVRCGGEEYRVYSTHGRGGGRTPGGRINSVAALAHSHPDCDLVTMGHNHGLDFTFLTAFEDHDLYVEVRKRAVALTGGFLQSKGDNYSRIAGYDPSVLGALGVYFHADHHNVHGRV